MDHGGGLAACISTLTFGIAQRMKIGIDSYSFHRIFGDVRGGETEPGRHFRSGSLDVSQLGTDQLPDPRQARLVGQCVNLHASILLT